jgi:uncharacterized RDD family membrane protein YckC
VLSLGMETATDRVVRLDAEGVSLGDVWLRLWVAGTELWLVVGRNEVLVRRKGVVEGVV